MSAWGKIVGAASITTGVAAAVALGGMTAQRRAVRRFRLPAGDDGAAPAYGTLVSDRSYSVVSDDGTVLHVEECGPENAPLTLVFAHGWALRLTAWHYQMLGLTGAGFGEGEGAPAARLVFYDQRSHGRSSIAEPGHSTINDLANDLAAVIATAAPNGPIVVIGHSMGGMATIALAGRQPELFADRVVGVGLISTSANQTRLPGMSDTLLTAGNPILRVLAGAASRYPQLFERGRNGSRDAAWLLTRSLAFGTADVPGDLVDYLDEMLSATPANVIAEFAPAVMSLNEVAALAALADIPAVVICGDADRMTPLIRSRFIAEALPGAELVVIPTAGHMAILEEPEAVNAALRRMLNCAAAKAGFMTDHQGSSK